MKDAGGEEVKTYEAYPAYDVVKKKFLELEYAASGFYAEFIAARIDPTLSGEEKRVRMKSNMASFKSIVMILYTLLGPKVERLKKVKKEYEELDILGRCDEDYDLFSIIKITEWKHLFNLLVGIIEDVGITKIEVDKDEEDAGGALPDFL